MNNNIRTIGCISSQPRQQIVFRSMLRLFSQASSNLRYQWEYRDAPPFDVTILDLDDDANLSVADNNISLTIAVISGKPERLVGRKYPLSKPLRGQDFLTLLQKIESTDSNR